MDEGRIDASPFKTALKWGVIGGAVSILISLLFHLMDIKNDNVGWIINLAILIAVVILAIKEHRDEDLGGYIEYSRGVGTGSLTTLFVALLSAVFVFIFMTYIDPSVIAERLEETRRELEESDISEKEMEDSMEMARIITQPAVMAIGSLIVNFLIGLVVSLISAAFLQRK